MNSSQTVAHEAEKEDLGHPDSLFGICQSVGEHLGFNPLYLRIALFVVLLFSPVAFALAYAGLGLVVALSHLVFPNPNTDAPWQPETAVSADKAEDQAYGPELMAA
jgi:phage shock protein PspC (stress-responsive transcriptional regulator)